MAHAIAACDLGNGRDFGYDEEEPANHANGRERKFAGAERRTGQRDGTPHGNVVLQKLTKLTKRKEDKEGVRFQPPVEREYIEIR